jgi:ceramide glucosyltransferase
LRRFWLLPVRDVLSFAVFAASFCGRNVLWRGQLFKIDEGGRISAEGDEPV